ncbi:MAG: formylglycine-generating enzyme family protein [Bacteroidetes bacterium]|nr:MAG: formylglycine-generating enzyme family protein [Bacteroidota bacterium]
MHTAPHAPELKTLTITGLHDLELVFVKGGEFLMGDDLSPYDREKPAHRVRLSDFWMGRWQVTQRLYEAVMGENPSNFKGSPRLPVENVNWHDAQTFCEKLNGMDEVQAFIKTKGLEGSFRLPTEAEWEYTASGGRYSAGYRYAGSDHLPQVGWYDGNSGDQTHEVGLLLPNELGPYDMSGNVREWCADWYSGSYYAACKENEPIQDPQGPDEGDNRVLRGGSYFNDPQNGRACLRHYSHPDYRNDHLGFRVAFAPR